MICAADYYVDDCESLFDSFCWLFLEECKSMVSFLNARVSCRVSFLGVSFDHAWLHGLNDQPKDDCWFTPKVLTRKKCEVLTDENLDGYVIKGNLRRLPREVN